MDVILLERVERLGAIGDVVKVRPGFARNFLLPQGKALRATADNIKRFEVEREALEKLNADRRDAARAQADAIEGLNVTLLRQAGESGQLYGSVSARDIADAATAGGTEVSRAQVVLDIPIKTIGLHSVRVRLHPEVALTVTVNVARTPEEAERQLRGEDVIASQADEDRAFAEAQAAELFEAAQENEGLRGGEDA